MRVYYPASNTHIHLKIARHSPCLSCGDCSGLTPPPNVQVVLDDSSPVESLLGTLDQYGSDDDDDTKTYLDSCACGHSVLDHGEDEDIIGPVEYARRGRVAIRLDELLQDADKLLDFYYTDDDIISLRRQMRLPTARSLSAHSTASNGFSSPASSDLSDDAPPPHKKRRLSPSSDSDDESDEEQPLATVLAQSSHNPAEKTPRVSGKRSGKKGPGKKTKASTAPTSLAPPTGQQQALMNGATNGVASHKSRVKVEDKMDEKQLDRLVTGVTVDTEGQASAVTSPKPEKASVIELRKGIIQITSVENDKQPRSLVILTGLKTLFQKQLPKMPREYIARLVYDTNSRGLAIVKRGYKVVGGICFRPFPHRGFAEIVFFATASVDQVKGYGAMLMDHFKAHIRRTYPSMMHFLTYADNYAVGYFEKQGFSKEITLNRSVWAGYIKDYEGGTIMQCTMLKKLDYLDKASVIAKQKEAILTKIREMSRSHMVYEGLQFQTDAMTGDIVPIDPRVIPGLRESGWTHAMASMAVRTAPRNSEQAFMERTLRELQNHPQSWAFLAPVSEVDVPDYYDVIKEPMDFRTMEHRLEMKQYNSLDAFVADAQLVFNNCRKYNPEGSIYAKNATKLEKFLKDLVADKK